MENSCFLSTLSAAASSWKCTSKDWSHVQCITNPCKPNAQRCSDDPGDGQHILLSSLYFFYFCWFIMYEWILVVLCIAKNIMRLSSFYQYLFFLILKMFDFQLYFSTLLWTFHFLCISSCFIFVFNFSLTFLFISF